MFETDAERKLRVPVSAFRFTLQRGNLSFTRFESLDSLQRRRSPMVLGTSSNLGMKSNGGG